MVRKDAPHKRARDGFIPSDDPAKDRARMVHTLFKTFHTKLDKDKRKDMIKKSTEILEIGDSDAFFAGKNPFVSGIAIFVYVCRHCSSDCKCPISYRDIRENVTYFASGDTFVNMLKKLST